ncbi:MULTISPECIES: hypothetical protein [Bacillaceae]|uniref:Uncharacterized protein n=1 Tax=Metabacillus endolithicus TaxID=1535204 RepID=A0ABW5BW12_9BACI|nr:MULTISPECIES: hypothetical protein [Bacillaceae]
MKNKNKKLSYESDGKMGKKDEKSSKNEKKEDPMFFNMTQNSE